MKFWQKRKKQKQVEHAKEKEQRYLQLNEALNELVALGIAVTEGGMYVYSPSFTTTVANIISLPPGKIKMLQLGNEAGRKLIPQVLALALEKPSKREIENLVVAYVCLKRHIDIQRLVVNPKLVPDLTYAIWYLNGHKPTLEEVYGWTAQK